MNNYIFSKVDTIEMAKKYGTPLYLMSEDIILERIDEIKREFLNKYENTKAFYAGKAFLTKEMVRIIKREGLGIDLVSGGEIYTALSVDFPMDKALFHGNNKSESELKMAIENDIGRIVVDGLSELKLIEEIANKLDKEINILLRISPGVDSDTHRYIKTSQVDSKFGFPLTENNMREAFNLISNSKKLKYLGLHFHIGSQIFENTSYLLGIEIIMELIHWIKKEFKMETKELNTGGGYGIKYLDEERINLKDFVEPIMEKIERESKKYELKRPKVMIEPGRWIVGEAGMTIYEVGSIKEIPNIRTYVSVDGGMTDNIRPSLYQAKYDGIVLNKMKEEKTELVTIVGKCCESGDVLIEDLKIPKVERGDYLGIFSTGAYNYSMASNYNRLLRPAVVMVKDGVDRLIVKRETYEDLLRNEI